MLILIVYLSLFIGLISFFLYGLYSYYRASKEEEKEWKEFLDSLTPGSKWKLQKEPSLNPFDEPSPDTIVIIIETRKNFYGDIWVQHQFEGCKSTCRELEADIFQRLYTKLN